ncbi:hypothetical protein M231_07184 [Tremella mesenterica]|uniref:Uncharacterized protein n=1 Tax=Tremella mesenterica TaxID=5217 RepID=A0A4Q1B9X0_TREME|nr:hypothetical protein M231_07184 [Tremella mesenterica]
MRVTTKTTGIVLLSALSAYAKVGTPLEIGQAGLAYLSPNCQQTVLQLARNSSLSQCLQLDALLPVLTTNSSILPTLDNYLSTLCSSSPCSNLTLSNATSTLLSGCSTDLASAKIDNSTVYSIVSLYPLAREIVCLKTSNPYNVSTTSNTTNTTNSTNTTLPSSSYNTTNSSSWSNTTSYNTTNGTFCLTSLATELSTYLDANLTNYYIDTFALGGNGTALQLLEKIPSTAICDSCVFAAFDLISQSVPQVNNYTIKNHTVAQYLNQTCSAEGFNVTINGTLPTNITEVAVNSTYPYTVVVGNTTLTPFNTSLPTASVNVSVSLPTSLTSVLTAVGSGATPSGSAEKRDVVGLKKRWIGA